jgi:uridine kinase
MCDRLRNVDPWADQLPDLMETGTRGELLERVLAVIQTVSVGHPLRVAVDGPPAVGKTTLADELGDALRVQGRHVIRASIECFLRPRTQRYRRGELSPEGCYHDSFDCDALRRVLLDPLGPGGDREFRRMVYDNRTDSRVTEPVTASPVDAVLLFEGVFLLRPELIDAWDLRILVSAAFEETVARARTRDAALYGAPVDVERRFRSRYRPSQQFYFDTIRPTDQADIVIRNDEPQRPAWSVRPRCSHLSQQLGERHPSLECAHLDAGRCD